MGRTFAYSRASTLGRRANWGSGCCPNRPRHERDCHSRNAQPRSDNESDRDGEAGVVGVSDATTGQAIAAFVIPSREVPESEREELATVLRAHVSREIGPIAKPRDIVLVPDLAKTRSGKIMRRLLVDLFEGRPLGDTTSLQDESVPRQIAERLAAVTRS